jgi:hypothetical protein
MHMSLGATIVLPPYTAPLDIEFAGAAKAAV